MRCPDGIPADFDVAEIEARLVKATRAWSDDLRDALIDEHGEEHASHMYERYEEAFPPGYRSDWIPRSAVADIARIEQLGPGEEPILNLYRPLEAPEGMVRCKLFSSGGISLSNVLPTFEHMGANALCGCLREDLLESRQRGRRLALPHQVGVAAPHACRKLTPS